MSRLNQYAELVFKYEIPDAVWGTISITEAERQIMQTPIFTRLLEVKQMGVASVAFPGAVHHRYQHSIGTMHVADRLLQMIKYVPHHAKEECYLGEVKDIEAQVRQCLRIGALLHDIGHPPLSHVIEEALRKYPSLLQLEDVYMTDFLKELAAKGRYSHEKATQYLIRRDPRLHELLEQHLKGEALDQLPLLAVGEAEKYPFNLLNPIINGDLDADKIDYLRRDGHHCGFLTTFNLSDFDGAVRIEQGNRKDDPPRVYVEEKALGVINAILHSRYREIDEFHHAEKPRIATQIIIDDLVEHLKQAPPDKLPRLIEDLHLQYRDSDLPRIFGSDDGCVGRLDAIRRGQVGYKEVFLKRQDGEEKPLGFVDFTPTMRICLHTVLEFPPAIAKAQELLRETLGNRSLIVDIRTAKPPRFSLNVNLRSKFKPTIFTVSETARGLLRDSIKNLKVHLYVPLETDLEVSVSAVIEDIQKSAVWCAEQYYSIGGGLFGHHLLLVVLKALLDHAKVEMDVERPWLYGQWQLQHILQLICESAKIKCPYVNTNSDIPNPVFVRDIEILTTMGLLQQRAVTVNVPTDDDMKCLNVDRHDLTLTPHGLQFYDKALLGNEPQRAANIVYDTVYGLQKAVGNDLEQFLCYERKLEFARAKPDQTTAEISSKRADIRRRLTGQACLIVD